VKSPGPDPDQAGYPIIVSARGSSRGPGYLPPDHEQESLFDWALLARYVAFVLHSIRRHKFLFSGIVTAIVVSSLAAMAVLPKTYHVETTLQAQRNQVISTLSNPQRSLQVADADAPTRQAAETVLRTDNLVALIHQTDFLEKWPLNRAPLLRLKDRIWKALFKPLTTDDQIEAFVYYLAAKFSVTTSEGTVTIAIDLPDPQLAYQMVETALQNFLEARHASDVSSIAEAITLLETRSGEAYQALANSLQKLQTVREERRARLGRQARSPIPAPVAAPIDPAVAQLLVQVQGKRRAIADLEEFRRRRISELQTRLQEQRAIYSENHPVVLDIQQSLDALRHESPQLVALRRELAALEEDARRRRLPVDNGLGELSRMTSVPREIQLELQDPRESEDPQIEYAKEQVRRDLAKYNDFSDRIEGARLELDTARAAFKYRYTVLRPVRRPRNPVAPKPFRVLGGSLVAGLVLAALAAALRDLHAGKLIEPWQVERALGIPLLGDVRLR